MAEEYIEHAAIWKREEHPPAGPPASGTGAGYRYRTIFTLYLPFLVMSAAVTSSRPLPATLTTSPALSSLLGLHPDRQLTRTSPADAREPENGSAHMWRARESDGARACLQAGIHAGNCDARLPRNPWIAYMPGGWQLPDGHRTLVAVQHAACLPACLPCRLGLPSGQPCREPLSTKPSRRPCPPTIRKPHPL